MVRLQAASAAHCSQPPTRGQRLHLLAPPSSSITNFIMSADAAAGHRSSGSAWTAGVSLFVAAAGAGLLSYPYAVMHQGILVNITLTLVFAVINIYSDLIIVQVRNRMRVQYRLRCVIRRIDCSVMDWVLADHLRPHSSTSLLDPLNTTAATTLRDHDYAPPATNSINVRSQFNRNSNVLTH